ncbi:heterokaryon incompatibility protein-domain-containing protein [Xylaria telfairii]|nr:heterokaryon incompatibility protein-domain-containing protein [Xylaria telfairii]
MAIWQRAIPIQVKMYIYSPLPQGAVRLLRFTSDARTNNLEFELSIFQIEEAPRFNALSYCWGDNLSKSASIQCNGCHMMITPILRDALQELITLNHGYIGWLWIDQICIDQANESERSSQVDMMWVIYKTSDRTIIWIGAKIPGVEAVEILLERLSQFYNQDLDPRGPRKRRRYTLEEYRMADLPHHEDPSWHILGEILSRPWFTRSWVVQEAALSKVTPLMLCGTYQLPWNSIVSSATWLLSICYRLTPLGRRPATIAAMRSLKLFNEFREVDLPWDITTLLNKTRRFKSSEPRDRVYSIIGLTGEADENGVPPTVLRANYTKSVRNTFRDITRYIIVSSGNLSILTLIRGHLDWSIYPSWVVDFSGDVIWERLSYFSWGPHAKGRPCVKELSNAAAGGLPAEVQHSPDDILALKGFRVDTVSNICEVMSNSSPDNLSFQGLLVWKEACQRLTSRYITTEALTRAVMITLSADWNLTSQTRVADQPTSHFTAFIKDAYYRMKSEQMQSRERAGLEDAYKTLLCQSTADVASDGNIYRLHLDAAHNRRILFTDKAYIALGPSRTEIGDLICILFGGATPMILRPFGDTYRFIGECYVYDLMNGEAVRDWQQGNFCLENFNLV